MGGGYATFWGESGISEGCWCELYRLRCVLLVRTHLWNDNAVKDQHVILSVRICVQILSLSCQLSVSRKLTGPDFRLLAFLGAEKCKFPKMGMVQDFGWSGDLGY